MANLLFYLVASIAVAASIGVVTARNPIFGVLCLLGSFFCLAVVYLLAGFQFLAAAQLLVYAGAIMVLFLFVIMLLNLGDAEDLKRLEGDPRSRRIALPMGVAGALLLLGMVAVRATDVRADVEGALPAAAPEDMGTLAALLFGKYTLPFEAAGVLLLAATLAVLVLAKRQRPGLEPESYRGLALATPQPEEPAGARSGGLPPIEVSDPEVAADGPETRRAPVCAGARGGDE